MIDKIKHMVFVFTFFLWYRLVLLTITLCSTFCTYNIFRIYMEVPFFQQEAELFNMAAVSVEV